MGKVPAYGKIWDLLKSGDLGTEVDQDSDFTIHQLERVHPKPTKSPTFRANYYSFVLIKEGNTEYSIDNRTFPTRNHTLYFTNPGHLKSFHIKEVSKGYLITVSENYLKQHIHASVFDEFSFLLTEIVPPCYLDGPPFMELYQLGAQIMEEERKKTLLRHKIVSSLFMVFLLKVKEYLLMDSDFQTEYDRDSEIVNRFKKDLESYFRDLTSRPIGKREIPQVQYFANEQHLNPGYFSTVIKTKTGRSTNQWIRDKMLSEAKALLSRSKIPVKEVAYSLGFQEPTHFSKYFKKHVGQSPLAFRRRL